jgi:hypothetical protein
MRRWTSEKDLAAMLIVRGHEGRQVKLSADTALFVGLKLITVSEKPTRNEVARLLCSCKCGDLCYACLGKANMIVNRYGHSIES